MARLLSSQSNSLIPDAAHCGLHNDSLWLSPATGPDVVRGLLKPLPARLMAAWSLSKTIGPPKNLSLRLADPTAASRGPPQISGLKSEGFKVPDTHYLTTTVIR